MAEKVTQPIANAEQPVGAAMPLPAVQIRLVDPRTRQARTIALPPEGLTVGRLPENGLVLDAPLVSRTHLRIDWDGQRVLVTDLGSRSGSQLGSTRLAPQAPEPWQADDYLQVGPYTLRLVGGAAAPRRPATGAYPALELPPARASVALGPGQDLLNLYPGQSVAVTATVRNLGPAADSFALAVEGLPAEWVKLPAALPIEAGAQAAAAITIAVPAEPSSRAAAYPVTVRASAQSNPADSAATFARWDVQPFSASRLELSPKRARTREQAVFSALVSNQGNAPARYTLGFDDDEHVLSGTFGQPQIAVEPGQAAEVPLTVLAPRKLVGASQRYSFSVRAGAAGQPSQIAQGQLVRESLLPIWLLPALALLLLLGGGALVVRALQTPPPTSVASAADEAGTAQAESAIAFQNASTAQANSTAAAALDARATNSAATQTQQAADTANAALLATATAQTATALASSYTPTPDRNAAAIAGTQTQQAVLLDTQQAGTATARARQTPSATPTRIATPKPTSVGVPTAVPTLAPTEVPTAEPAPVLAVNTKKLTFAATRLEQTSEEQTITLTNNGNAALVIEDMAPEGTNADDFTLSKTSCGTLDPGDSCTINVKFEPNDIGNRTASLPIRSNAPGGTENVQLTGIGLAAQPVVVDVRSNTAEKVYKKAGDTITIIVEFSENITVQGRPRLRLDMRADDRNVDMSSSSGNTLTFNYTVRDEDNSSDLDYVASESLTLNGGSITATSDNEEADRTLPDPGEDHSLGDNADIVIDTSEPEVTASELDDPTNDSTPTLQATANDNADGSGIKRVVFQVRCKDSTCNPANADWTIVGESRTPAQTSQYEFTVTSPLSGTYELHAVAEDNAGNTVTSSNVELIVDVTEPLAPTITNPEVDNSIIDDDTPTISGTAEAGSTVIVTEDGNEKCTDTFIDSRNWSCTSSSLGNRKHTITVTAADAAGNVSPVATRTFTVDTQPPVITPNSFHVTVSGTSVTFVVEVTDNIGIQSVQFRERVRNGGNWGGWHDIGDPLSNAPYQLTADHDPGQYQAMVVAIDRANQSVEMEYSETFTVPTPPPPAPQARAAPGPREGARHVASSKRHAEIHVAMLTSRLLLARRSSVVGRRSSVVDSRH